MDGWVPCGTGLAPLGMVISVPVFQRMALGKIIKVNFYGLFQSLDLRGVRLFLSQLTRRKIRQNQSNLWPTHRLEGRPDGQNEEQKGEAEPPLGHHLDPPLHLPRPPPLNCPQAAQLPALLRPPAPASRGAPTGLLGGGPVSFLLGARRARSGCG